MSWDADLICPHCDQEIAGFNYTHNTNGMVNEAMHAVYPISEDPLTWWKRLDGWTGEESYEFLDSIIDWLGTHEEDMRTMEPDNGWGDFDGIMRVLCDMKDAAEDHPNHIWQTNG